MNFEDYESLPTNNVLTHMTAGAIAGVMEHCVMYPLDSVKTRMQSLSTSGNQSIGGTLVQMMKKEGVLRPVRGMSAMVIGAGPSHALYFSCYEYLKNLLTNCSPSPSYYTLAYGVSGCAATLLHDGIMTPAEVVKQRIQMVNSPFKSVLHCCSHIYKTEGLRAFYRSYTTQLTMNIPFQSIHFMVYEFAQKTANKERRYNPIAHMLSGAVAGAIAAAATTPLDVCKTLLNTQQDGATIGMLNAVKRVYRLGGFTGYFRGLQARVVYQMPATAICWSTYEFFKNILLTTSDVRITPGTVLAEEETAEINETSNIEKQVLPAEKISLKPRELPAMSGASLYGSISFNTMHTADPSFNNRRQDSMLDLIHT